MLLDKSIQLVLQMLVLVKLPVHTVYNEVYREKYSYYNQWEN